MNRSPALTRLSQDHHTALVLCKRIEKVSTDAERHALSKLLPETFAAGLSGGK